MPIVNDWELILRLLIAIICGFIVGMERKNRSKEAGVRTHTIICLGSCLLMIVSKYGFNDIGAGKFDAARIAAQVVSGIGFLGTGMIIVRHRTVSGLTTAAGMWATSAVGLAIGAGMYVIGVGTAALIVIVQLVFHIKALAPTIKGGDELIVICEDDKSEVVINFLRNHDIQFTDLKMERLDGHRMSLVMSVTLDADKDVMLVQYLMNLDPGIYKAEVSVE